MRVASITQGMVFDEYKRITGSGNIDRKAFNKAKCLLDAVFDVAMEAKIIDYNPSRTVPKSRLKFKIPNDNTKKVYTKEDRDTLFRYLNTQKPTVFTLAIQLAFCFPCRISELQALTWDDINEGNQTLQIHHEIVLAAEGKVKRAFHDVPRTKTNTVEGIRTLPISKDASEILEKLRVINGDKKYILNSTKNGTRSPQIDLMSISRNTVRNAVFRTILHIKYGFSERQKCLTWDLNPSRLGRSWAIRLLP